MRVYFPFKKNKYTGDIDYSRNTREMILEPAHFIPDPEVVTDPMDKIIDIKPIKIITN